MDAFGHEPAGHPMLLRLSHALLRRADNSRGSRNCILKLDADCLPEAHGPAGPDEVERLRLLLGTLEATGWVRLKLAKPKPFQTFTDLNPALELLDFDALAAWSGFVSRHEAWVRRFVRAMREDAALLAVDVGVQREDLLDHLLRSPLAALEGMAFDGAARALSLLHQRCRDQNSCHLRQLSAQIFHGRSKILDSREELLRLLGAKPGQFHEPPVQLLVDVPAAQLSDVLFVENSVTFEAMCEGRRPGCSWERTALVYAAGFKSGARRLRQRGGSRVYWRGTSAIAGDDNRVQQQRFCDWLYGSDDGTLLPVSFFGDLDFAGMGILASLRVGFAQCMSWVPGYAPLLDMLRAGQGHRPEEADKAGQTDPGITGCRHTDEELLPAMRSIGMFVDQEAWDLW